jgi:hypothetical protein
VLLDLATEKLRLGECVRTLAGRAMADDAAIAPRVMAIKKSLLGFILFCPFVLID